jgi:hypothetical protein
MSRNQLTLQPARIRRGILELGDLIPALPGPGNCAGDHQPFDELLLYDVPPQRVVDDAADVCADCPVRRACYDGAVQRGERHGMWGGELFPIGTARRKAPAPAQRCAVCNGPASTPRSKYCDTCRPQTGYSGRTPGSTVDHGTTAAYRWHSRHNVPMCEPCRQAESLGKAARRAAQA